MFPFIPNRAISQAAGKNVGLGEEDENNTQYVKLLLVFVPTSSVCCILVLLKTLYLVLNHFKMH